MSGLPPGFQLVGTAARLPAGLTGAPSTTGQPAVPQDAATVTQLIDTTQVARQQAAEYQAELAQYNGDIAEGQAYSNSEAIAAQNARLALVSGQVQQAQERRQVVQTTGTQQAAVAGNGLGSGGSAAYLLRDSLAQGALASQLIGVNADLASAGYTEQASAAAAEGTAVNAAASVALTTANLAQTDAQQTQANALNYAAALSASGGATTLPGTTPGPYGQVIQNVTNQLKAAI